MKTSTKFSKAMGAKPWTARLYIGLIILLSGFLLACLLLVLNPLSSQVVLANIDSTLHSANSTPNILSVDPPTGTLDGFLIDDMENVTEWQVGMGDSAISATLTSVPGYIGQAIQLNYHLSATSGITNNWVQLVYNFVASDTLSTTSHIRFYYRGNVTNTLQIGLISTTGEIYFSSDINKVTHVPTWTYITWDLQSLRNDVHGAWSPDNKVKSIFISIKESDKDDVAGQGFFEIDQLEYIHIATRTVPTMYEYAIAEPVVARLAALWIAASQQANGLLKSWLEETDDFAWLYDQALGLIVFSETDLARAQQLADRLHELQNEKDGSWNSGFHHNSVPITSVQPTTQPVGANAWTVYALAYYASKSGSQAALQDAREGADWLASLQRTDGSLPAISGEDTAPTEPNLDAWWAFKAVGYETQANALQEFLLKEAWDNSMGRFKASPTSHEIFLDNQTWGAAFLHAIGREADARRALSYARWTLATTSRDGSTDGFDGAGPFSVWNEGTLQYIAAYGENSQYYWEEMVAQQASDGGLPGSPDQFSGYSVWLTRMHGVAPTAWLYFAGTGGPFQPQAAFAASHISGITPLTVVFTNTSSSIIMDSLWTFGDGETSAQLNPTHTYTVPGVYTVTLKVSGPGGSDTITKTSFITAYDAAQADFDAAPNSGKSPLTVTFTNTSSGDYSDILWDFGDGITSMQTSDTHTHTYTMPGVYTVTLTVSGSGGSDKKIDTIVVFGAYLPIIFK